MIPLVMAGKLFEGARDAVSGVAGAARHLAWYLSYCVDGSATRPFDAAVPEHGLSDATHRRAS